jgi:hypothetical protein
MKEVIEYWKKWDGISSDYKNATYIHANTMFKFVEDYHKHKLLLNRADVNSSVDSIINYIENDAEIAMPINELMNEDGTRQTKKEYGKVLIKYLVKELREHYFINGANCMKKN